MLTSEVPLARRQDRLNVQQWVRLLLVLPLVPVMCYTGPSITASFLCIVMAAGCAACVVLLRCPAVWRACWSGQVRCDRASAGGVRLLVSPQKASHPSPLDSSNSVSEKPLAGTELYLWPSPCSVGKARCCCWCKQMCENQGISCIRYAAILGELLAFVWPCMSLCSCITCVTHLKPLNCRCQESFELTAFANVAGITVLIFLSDKALI